MRISPSLLMIFLSASLAAHAEGVPQTGTVIEAAPKAAKPDDRVRTVIVGLQPRRGVEDKQLVSALSDIVQGVYGRDLRRIVIGRDDIARVLELEAEKQSAGCDSDKCLAEIGQALDAARIVVGSLDKIGDGYMVTMAEIDTRTVEAIARVQDRVSSDENALVETVTRLATELNQKGGAGVAARLTGNAGSIEIETDPRGAKVVLAGNDMGESPTAIHNLATGKQHLRLIRTDYEPVEVDVAIYPGGVTKVRAELCLMRALAESNLAAKQAVWQDEALWHAVGAWTKVGAGAVVGLGGTAAAALAVASPTKDDGPLAGLIVTAVGSAVFTWGVVDFFTAPKAPIPEWEVERKLTVTPPGAEGPAVVRVLQGGATKKK